MDPQTTRNIAQGGDALGTVLGSYGRWRTGDVLAERGRRLDDQAQSEATQLEVQAGQQQAVAQRAMLNERRRERIVQSNLTAAAAAQGGGAADPTIMKLAGDIAAEGEYRALTALYQGDEAARQLKTAALTRRYEGREARRAGKIQQSAARTKAGLTLLGGATSFYTKYGDKAVRPTLSSSLTVDELEDDTIYGRGGF